VRNLGDADRQTEDEVPAWRWRAAVTETRAVYVKADETWRPYSCPSSADCCHKAMSSRPPWLWPSEWRLLVDALAREKRPLPPPRADGACPFLDAAGKRCTVYASRPFGCRTFFCEKVKGPSVQPSEGTNALLERLEALNVALDAGAKPRSLPEWIESARLADVRSVADE
jgi:Fe-S-cluster containining protein